MELKEKKNFLKTLLGYFLKGLLITAPFYFTISLVRNAIKTVDNLLHLSTPGLGILLVIVFATFVGCLGSTIIIKSLFESVEGLIKKVPLMNSLYTSAKELFGAFVGDKKKFDKPVLVTIDKNAQMYRIGFITQEDLSSIGLPDMISVYMLESYSLSGELIILPKDSVQLMNISGAEITKFVMSGGVTTISK